MSEPSELGRRLRETREAAGIPASALGVAAGASRDFVRQVEEGLIARPSLALVAGVAEVLGVSLDWLVSGRGEGPGAQELESALDRVRNEVLRRQAEADEPVPFVPTAKTGS